MAKKRLLCMILCALMTAGTLLSCSESGDSGAADASTTGTEAAAAEAGEAAAEEVPEETERPLAEATLTIKDFEGRDYRMISTNQDSRHVDILAARR